MLDKRYGLKYSMPHSVVHIIDNSMYNGELPTVVTDDPSVYSTIVVTGSPMGVDNEIVNLTRSDVLNVAFGMGNVSAPDIKKYGQSITYPADLINQNVPVKLLRVTPEGSTYAFSCLLIQWRIEDNVLYIKYKTSDEVTANGIPAGKILTNFKNPKRLHDAFVNGMDKTFVDDDGNEWNQRVFMTFIAAGRGSAYNKYRVTINPVQQTRRPANIKYMFTTLDTIDGVTVEKFFSSIFNENNETRPDAADPLNVVVGQRVPGSSIIIPTINEDAVRELYNVYMNLLKSNIDNRIYANYVISDKSYYDDVYKRMSLNIFDPIFGRYIYNGDSDVKLPFIQLEMSNIDVPMLDSGHIIYDTLGLTKDTSPSIKAETYRAKLTRPTKLYDLLLDKKVLYGINNETDTYHVGNVYLPDMVSNTLYMTTTINQSTGAVTNIPIYQVSYDENGDNATISKDNFKYTIDIGEIADVTVTADVKTAIEDAIKKMISKKEYQPTIQTSIVSQGSSVEYKPDWILFTYSLPNDKFVIKYNSINAKRFGIARITYTNSGANAAINPTPAANEIYTSKSEIYKALVYPSTTVASFAYNSHQQYYNKLGSTIIDTASATGENDIVYVNLYDINKGILSDDDYKKMYIAEDNPFVANVKPPESVKIETNISGESIDLIEYVSAKYRFNKSTFKFEYGIDSSTFGYTVGQIIGLVEYPDVQFKINSVEYAAKTDPSSGKIVYHITTDGGQTSDWVPSDNIEFAWEKCYISTMTIEPISTFDSVLTEAKNYNLDSRVIKHIDYAGPPYKAGKYYVKRTNPSGYSQYQPDTPPTELEWREIYPTLYTKTSDDPEEYTQNNTAEAMYTPDFANPPEGKVWYKLNTDSNAYEELTTQPEDWVTKYFNYYVGTTATQSGATIHIDPATDINVVSDEKVPYGITRFDIVGPAGSIYSYTINNNSIPANYYVGEYGKNPTSEAGGIPISHGSTGFFDTETNPIIFKWKYSELLVRAYKGLIDPRIKSPTRCPAKYLFDGGTNTIIGQTILPYMTYSPTDIILASTIFTDEEKEEVQLNEDIINNNIYGYDQTIGIDVKQAMYDLMEYRCYYGMPEDKRPIGPGSGLSLHLDSGVTSAATTLLMNTSFIKRFTNPNASWDIGGYTSMTDGITYTYVKRIVQNIFSHMRQFSVNKPFVGKYTNVASNEYTSFYPDIDTTDWEEREMYYNSGGNAWIMDVNGNLQRRSQRSLYREGDTSDLIQENNMRTLSLLVYLLQNKIDTYLLEYNDDGVLKTLKDDVDNMFTNWVGNLVQALDIRFERDINPFDGGEIVVCYCDVTFRGLILRVPIIVNVQRRAEG